MTQGFRASTTLIEKPMDRWIDAWVGEWMDVCIDGGRVDNVKDGLMKGMCMDGWMDR